MAAVSTRITRRDDVFMPTGRRDPSDCEAPASHPPAANRHSGHAGGKMSDESEPAVGADLIGERRHLLSLAFRMLGTVAEAEDAVQEAYIRWYRLDQAERDAIVVPRAWLTRAA